MKHRWLIALAMIGWGLTVSAREHVFRLPKRYIIPDQRLRGFNHEGKYALEWANKGYAQSDFDAIADEGFNLVRLILDYRCYTKRGDWNSFNETDLKQIDQALAWCMERGIAVMINLHRAPGFCIHDPDGVPPASKVGDAQRGSLWTDPRSREAFLAHWTMFAKRYARVPAGSLLFNLVNEPNGTDPSTYIGLMTETARAVRTVRADRPIVLDGLEVGTRLNEELVEAALRERFILSKHCYEPKTITHYRANWVEGARDWAPPLWPPNNLSGYLYGPHKKSEASERTLRLLGSFPKGTTVSIKIRQVSGDGKLDFRADGTTFFSKEFRQGPGIGEWQKVVEAKRWGIFQNVYNRDYGTVLNKTAKEIVIEFVRGDWLTFTQLCVKPPRGESHLFYPSRWEWGERQHSFVLSPEGNDISMAPDELNTFDPFGLKEWVEAQHRGVQVLIGEFGVYSKTPHDVAMALQEAKLKAFQEAGFGWCLFSLKGDFGPFNPNRRGIPLDKIRGMDVDRTYMELLKKY